MKEWLYDRLCRTLTELGFSVCSPGIFRSEDKYVRIECGEKYASVELGFTQDEAENNVYEDIDLYDYDYMRGHGFPTDDDIFNEIRSDIIKYVINK